ncbi:hypothetical protein GCM10027612_05630 [Microbispora bryophytorum subsp. camponoti]
MRYPAYAATATSELSAGTLRSKPSRYCRMSVCTLRVSSAAGKRPSDASSASSRSSGRVDTAFMMPRSAQAVETPSRTITWQEAPS